MELNIDGIKVTWAVSKGKKLRITISPKTGKVSVHVPKNYSETKAAEFVKDNAEWIQKYQTKIYERINALKQKDILEEGKTVSLWGNAYKIKIVKGKKYSSYYTDEEYIYLKEGCESGMKKRLLVLNKLYKAELEIYINEILPFWEHTIKEKAAQIKFRDMKSKWGSCNRQSGIITLNIKLAAFPCECAEMVLVHEFVHFKERLHNDRFKRYMTKYLPDWKARVKILNSFL